MHDRNIQHTPDTGIQPVENPPKTTEYTPGPWNLADEHLPNVAVQAADGLWIATLYMHVCTPQMPNARLIAAAPELLKALKACHLQMLQSNNDSDYAWEANQMAIAAISKAEAH